MAPLARLEQAHTAHHVAIEVETYHTNVSGVEHQVVAATTPAKPHPFCTRAMSDVLRSEKVSYIYSTRLVVMILQIMYLVLAVLLAAEFVCYTDNECLGWETRQFSLGEGSFHGKSFSLNMKQTARKVHFCHCHQQVSLNLHETYAGFVR